MHVLTHAELQAVLEKTRQGLVEIFGDKLEKLLLYGSYAKGEARPESDIDLFIVVNIAPEDLVTSHRKVSDFTSSVDLEHGVLLNTILRDLETFQEQRNSNPFLVDVLATGIDFLHADIEKRLADIPVTISFKINAQIYEQAKALFASLGFTMEEACNLFIEESLACGGFPFPCNEKDIRGTQAIMEASERIQRKHREAYVALAGGFSEDYMDSGREEWPQKREEL